MDIEDDIVVPSARVREVRVCGREPASPVCLLQPLSLSRPQDVVESTDIWKKRKEMVEYEAKREGAESSPVRLTHSLPR